MASVPERLADAFIFHIAQQGRRCGPVPQIVEPDRWQRVTHDRRLIGMNGEAVTTGDRLGGAVLGGVSVPDESVLLDEVFEPREDPLRT